MPGTALFPILPAVNRAWTILILAGLLETVWAIGLKYSHGFTRPTPTAITVAAMVASMYLLAVAVRTLPIGTAYAVWTGIGALGAAILGMVLLGEPRHPLRLLSLALVIVGVVGLKLTVRG
jgi:quaternary ammonium compound-resistance protein SugE